MLAGEDGGPTWRANGIGHRGIRKAHAHFRDAVDIWGLDKSIAVRRNGLVGMVIRHDKNDVGTVFGARARALCPSRNDNQ